MRGRSVALVGDDLMFASQLQAALATRGGTCALVIGDRVPRADCVFVDLNRDTDHRLALIATLRRERPAQEIVGFCHHGERGLRRQALEAGASRVINNGALQTVALHLVGINVRNRV